MEIERININELSLGCYVLCFDEQDMALCQVIEITRDARIGAKILRTTEFGKRLEVGHTEMFSVENVHGLSCRGGNLKSLGFVASDERGWELVYWFGTDMKLLYHRDKRKQTASFRFKTDYRKHYVSISCRYVHELQNIMRFLTGGELEFDYREIRENISGPAKY